MFYFKQSIEVEEEASDNESNYVPDSNDWVERLNSDEKVSYLNN